MIECGFNFVDMKTVTPDNITAKVASSDPRSYLFQSKEHESILQFVSIEYEQYLLQGYLCGRPWS